MRQIVELAFFTEDVLALSRFYQEIFDRPPAFQSEDMAMFQLEGLHVLIHHRAPAAPAYETDPEAPPNEDHFAVGVTSLDKTWQASSLDANPDALTPQTYPWGRSAYVRDPDGRLVELQQSRPSHS